MCSAPAKTATGFFVFSFRCLLFVLLGSFSFAWTNTGGGDHGGADWAPVNGATIGGDHTNVNTFTVSGTVYVNSGTPLQVYARTINVAGTINGDYAGYAGGTGGSTGGCGGSGECAYSNGGTGGGDGGASGSGCCRLGGGGGGGGGYGGRGAPGGNSGGGQGGGSGDTLKGGTYTRTIEMGSGAGGGGAGGSCWNSGGAGGSYGGGGSASGGGCDYPAQGCRCTGEGYSRRCGCDVPARHEDCVGGAGGGNSGRGGGAVLLNASTVSISGTILVNGGGGAGGGCGNSGSSSCEAGEGGGGGSGASGGGVLVIGDSITFTGVIKAKGGPAGGGAGKVCDSSHYHSPGNAGGQGGGGRVKLFAASALSATGSVDVSGYESGTYKYCLGVCIEVNSTCPGGYLYDGECDSIPPRGTISINNGADYVTSRSVTLSLYCFDGESGCSKMSMSNDGFSYSAEENYAVSKSWALVSGDGSKTVYVRFKDVAGNWGPFSDSIFLDTTPPQLYSVSRSPDPFSPNGDGIMDGVSIGFSTDQEEDGTGYAATMKVYGPSGLVRTLFENKPVNAGAHSEVWDGRNDAGAVVPGGVYSHTITVVDRVGNSNSTLGYVHVDLSGPQFLEHSPVNSVVELGDPVKFSATLSDVSGVDSVFACKTSANCHNNPAQQFCRLDNTSRYRDKFSCSFAPSTIGTYLYYLFANDTQNISSSAGGSFRVRNVGVSVDAGPRIIDRQGSVRIAADYTENSSYPIGGAACSISGDVSSSMVFDGVQYYANNVPPSRLEDNSFTVTCSKLGFPARSASGSFLARDLSIGLGYEYEPLAAGKPNFLYARVKTVSRYAPVESANKVVFNVTREADGFLVPSGNFVWNPATGRWEAGFTPPDDGNYTARAYFNATVEGGVLDGFSSIRMAAGKGFKLSSDISGPLSVDLGSSGLADILVENRRSKDVLYNITLTGDLYPISFDGQALSSRIHKTFVFVPAGSLQSHPLLIRGLEVSPFAKEVQLRFREAQPPYGSGNITITYTVVSSLGNRKFAPDLDFAAIILLALFSLLFVSDRKSLLVLQP